MARGWRLLHQSLALQVVAVDDGQYILQGSTRLEVEVQDEETKLALQTVFLNCGKRLEIVDVLVGDHAVPTWSRDDGRHWSERARTLEASSSLLPPSVEHHQLYKRELVRAGYRRDEGELAVEVGALDSRQFALTIHFKRPDLLTGKSFASVPSNVDDPRASRDWWPCVDSLWERCTWDMDVVLPKAAGTGPQTIVLASGQLVEEREAEDRTWFRFKNNLPTSVHHIGIVVGPFQALELGPKLKVYCQPEVYTDLDSCDFLGQLMDFYSQEYGSYPFDTYTLVFEEETTAVRSFSSLTVLSADLLTPRDVIDQVFPTRVILSLALIRQWIGVDIVQKTWADTWLIEGLTRYLAGLACRKMFGNNQYRYQLRKDILQCCQWDIYRPPLCHANMIERPSPADAEFHALKAPLVLNVLDRRLVKSGTSLGLSRVIPKLLLSAISGDLAGNLLSTHSFLRMVRKVTGADVKAFADQYIYGSGCPAFQCRAFFNRKKMAVELQINQTCAAATAAEETRIERGEDEKAEEGGGDQDTLRPTKLFTGPLTVRIHEADGTPYEHIIPIEEKSKRYEILYNTKYRRRRGSKRFVARQAAAARAARMAATTGATTAAAQEDNEDEEEGPYVEDVAFGATLWDDDRVRADWRIADWSDEDELAMQASAYEWVRIDADMDWIATFDCPQPNFMLASQLSKDRDVAAQSEAIQLLTLEKTEMVAGLLTTVVLVDKYFYRVRIEAVHALASFALDSLHQIGLFHLLKIYRLIYCEAEYDRSPSSWLEEPYIPKDNNFNNFARYFIQKAIVGAIGNIKDSRGISMVQAKRMLLDLLYFNDNTGNKYTDCYWIVALIESMACAFTPSPDVPLADDAEEDRLLLQQAVEEVQRVMVLDRLAPSFHNSMTVAALHFMTKLVMANVIPYDKTFFMAYSREDNYIQVRLAACEAMVLLGGLQDPIILKYLFNLVIYDSSPRVRHAVTEDLCAALAILVASSDLGSAIGKEENTFVEEEGVAAIHLVDSSRKDAFSLSKTLRLIRKELGRQPHIKDSLWQAVTFDLVDDTSRQNLIRLCEILYRPVEEALPKLKLRMPSASAAADQPSADLATPSITRIRFSATPLSEQAPAATTNGFKIRMAAPPSQPVPKVTKERTVPQAEKGGMSSFDVKACRSILKRLQGSKFALIFRNPVDPVRDNAPNYYQIIQEPIDLQTMEAKLNSGAYGDRFELEADFRKMIENAYRYNAPGSFGTLQADGLKTYFDQQWARINTTMQAATQAQEARKAALVPVSSPPVIPATALSKSMPPPTGPVSKPLAIRLKMKDSPTPASQPPPQIKGSPKRSGSQLPVSTTSAVGKAPLDRVKARILLNKMTADQNAYIFLKPVDPVRDGCPTYYDEIKTPMDFSLITKKLEENRYPHEADFLRDIQLIFENCRRFNPPQTYPTQAAAALEKLFQEEWGKLKEKKLSFHEKRALQGLLNRLRTDPLSTIFLEPVDPVALGIPQYYSIIPKEKTRDLKTIRQRLDRDGYHSLDMLESDMKLMISNALTFNPPKTPAHDITLQFSKMWNKAWHEYKLARKMNKMDGPEMADREGKRSRT